MKSFAFAAVAGVATAVSVSEVEYMNYLAKFNKFSNDVEEFNFRRELFEQFDKFVKTHNASNSSFKVAHNQFSDWTRAEYKSILGYKSGELDARKAPVHLEPTNASYKNWVEEGAVTPVKDQGACGSCWAFSSTGSIEGAHAVATGELLSFSEQQLVDCAFLSYGNLGCGGGLQTNAYNYYEAGNLAELESVYPYTAGDGSVISGTCQYDSKSKTAVTVTSFDNITPNSIDQMKAGLDKQPLAVAIEADTRAFQGYTSGVFDDASCGTTLDHAVLAVGYGTEDGQDYWLVKNSWNTTWGDAGYIKIAQVAGEGICGVQMDPQIPYTN